MVMQAAVAEVKKKPESKLTVKNISITSLAGGVSGALEILFTYPFEFAKTQQQLEPKKYAGKPFWLCWKDVYGEFGGFPKGFTGQYSAFSSCGYMVLISPSHLSWNASTHLVWRSP